LLYAGIDPNLEALSFCSGLRFSILPGMGAYLPMLSLISRE